MDWQITPCNNSRVPGMSSCPTGVPITSNVRPYMSEMEGPPGRISQCSIVHAFAAASLKQPDGAHGMVASAPLETTKVRSHAVDIGFTCDVPPSAPAGTTSLKHSASVGVCQSEAFHLGFAPPFAAAFALDGSVGNVVIIEVAKAVQFNVLPYQADVPAI